MVLLLLSFFMHSELAAIGQEAKDSNAQAPAAPVQAAPAQPVTASSPDKAVIPEKATAPAPEKTTSEPQTAPTSTAPKSSAAEESEYEVDTDEEAGDTEEEAPEEAPPPKKVQKGKGKTATPSIGGSGGVQGSRAKNRFAPILKSETKSVYKKDGKTLDVDTD